MYNLANIVQINVVDPTEKNPNLAIRIRNTRANIITIIRITGTTEGIWFQSMNLCYQYLLNAKPLTR
jgi:hypothetical protein